jgi:hypothetical protein
MKGIFLRREDEGPRKLGRILECRIGAQERSGIDIRYTLVAQGSKKDKLNQC